MPLLCEIHILVVQELDDRACECAILIDIAPGRRQYFFFHLGVLLGDTLEALVMSIFGWFYDIFNVSSMSGCAKWVFGSRNEIREFKDALLGAQ